MLLLTTFVAAVLLSSPACVASGAGVLIGDGGGRGSSGGGRSVDAAQSNVAPQSEKRGALADKDTGSSSSPSSSFSALSTSGSFQFNASSLQWETVCGRQPHGRCLALYISAGVGFLVLLSALCAWWVVRWWRCGGRGLYGWQRLDRSGSRVDQDNANDNNDDGFEGSFHAGDSEREGLLSRVREGHVRDGDESSTATHRDSEGASDGRMARYVRRLNLHGTRLWTVLLMTPAGLLYGSSLQPSSPSPRVRSESEEAENAEESVNEGVSSGRALWDDQRGTRSVSAASSANRSYMRTVMSVATTTADSSESGNDSGRHSQDSDAGHNGHRPHLLACESECVDDVVTENECAVRRSAGAIVAPTTPLTPHVLPQLVNYNAASAHDEDEGGCGENTDSDSQQMGGPAERALSSLTASVSSASHSPSFLHVASQLSCGGSSESVSRLDASDHEGADSLTNRLGFPHVETAIFDTSINACMAVQKRSIVVDPSIVNALFEPDHFPRSSSATHLVVGDAPISSGAASHISALDCRASPPFNSGTATPTSLRGSASCLPLAQLPATGLPVSHSLNDGLDMEGEAIVEDFEATQKSRSYVPAVQQPQQQPQQPQHGVHACNTAKPRRTRSSSHYSEPWQPVLVQRPLPLLAAAASVAQLPVVALSTSPIASAPPPTTTALRDSPLVASRAMSDNLGGELEDELDDLMLEDDNASAQSNQTGESGHIFSGSSTSTSRTVTPATETDPESVVGTPTMFYAAAMANGGCLDGAGFLTVIPPASASIPLDPESPPVAIYARTLGCHDGFLCREDESRGCTPPWLSRSVGRRPLNLSVEERTLLMKSRKWLFPLIDGADEIESGVVGESEGSFFAEAVEPAKANSL